MTRPRFIGGALLAAAVAGPLTLLVPLLWLLPWQPRASWGALTAVPPILAVALPFGFVVSVLPAVAAAASLAYIGKRHALARRWPVWAAAGLAVGVAVSALAFHRLDTGNIVFGSVGALCALLARWRTRWPHPAR